MLTLQKWCRACGTHLSLAPGLPPVPRISQPSPIQEFAISRKAFLISLTVLTAAFLWLSGLIGHWGSRHAPSIGGGSYSLDRFVYSGLIIILTAGWSFGTLLLGMACKDAARAKRAFTLSAVGFAALVAACWMYGPNLH
jgi:hypothetical protein